MNKVGNILNNISIKSIQKIFSSLLEPTVLYNFLKTIYQYYGIFKLNYKKLLNYYIVISGLNSFQLQYNLLDYNERKELYDYIQVIKSNVIGSCNDDFNHDKDEIMIKIAQVETLFID